MAVCLKNSFFWDLIPWYLVVGGPDFPEEHNAFIFKGLEV
jgi:hypothetical protein